ncbi:hypothetical protein [uncultured Aquimarina sp.]|uniref:OB-fold protein n=1 Tax=uncultured Aquimarina sp. TaxID=575652 RepID=UPI00262314C3|nr:hypothetical protein [uncultured Aquimarina sp.]
MTKKTKKLLILYFFAAILVVSIITVKIYNKPFINIAESKPSLSLASEALLSDFINDESTANTMYLEELIQVNGTITAIEKGKDGNDIITLGNENTIGSIICHLSKNEKNLKTGQEISIKGICTGYLMDVILVKCVIVP